MTTLLGYNTSSETHEESMTNEVPWKLGDFSPAKMGSISSYITVLCAWLYDEEKDILLTYNISRSRRKPSLFRIKHTYTAYLRHISIKIMLKINRERSEQRNNWEKNSVLGIKNYRSAAVRGEGAGCAPRGSASNSNIHVI